MALGVPQFNRDVTGQARIIRLYPNTVGVSTSTDGDPEQEFDILFRGATMLDGSDFIFQSACP